MATKDKVREAQTAKAWRLAHPTHAQDWVKAHQERQTVHLRKHHLKRKFGMTQEDYDTLLVKQGGVCASCGTNATSPWAWFCIDHDHVTGKVRGLLCRACNSCMGQAGDNPIRLRQAAAYLEAAAENYEIQTSENLTTSDI